MRILRIIVFLLLVSGFSLNPSAQADCRSGFGFNITDDAGKSVENAKLELISLDSRVKLPSYVKLIKMGETYLFTSHAGMTINGDFKVIISADGFQVYQQKVIFPTCSIEQFEITLDRQKTSVLSGSIYDANGAVILNARVIAIGENGEKIETRPDDEGVYTLILPFRNYEEAVSNANFKIARYDIRVESTHFKVFELKGFLFVPSYKGKMVLDIALDLLGNDNCGAGGCILLEPVNSPDIKLSNNVVKLPLEELPKAKNKKKRKNNNQ